MYKQLQPLSPPALSLTCWGLRSPAGPVVVSLPARVVVNLLTPALVVSCRPPCARCSLAGAVVAPRCCREPTGAVVTRPCCREPAGAVVTCRPHLRRVVCTFVVGQCWPPLVLVALHRLSLHLLRCVVHPCACHVVSVSCCPPHVRCVVWAFVMSSLRSRVMLFPVVVVWTCWRSSASVTWHLGPVHLVVAVWVDGSGRVLTLRLIRHHRRRWWVLVLGWWGSLAGVVDDRRWWVSCGGAWCGSAVWDWNWAVVGGKGVWTH